MRKLYRLSKSDKCFLGKKGKIRGNQILEGKIKQGRWVGNWEVKGCYYKNGVWKVFAELTIEQKLKEVERVSHLDSWGKIILGRGEKKGSEAGVFQNCKKTCLNKAGVGSREV